MRFTRLVLAPILTCAEKRPRRQAPVGLCEYTTGKDWREHQHQLAGGGVPDGPAHGDLAAGRPRALGVARADKTNGRWTGVAEAAGAIASHDKYAAPSATALRKTIIDHVSLSPSVGYLVGDGPARRAGRRGRPPGANPS